MRREGSEIAFLAEFADNQQPDAPAPQRSCESDKPKATLIKICPTHSGLSESQRHDQQAAPCNYTLPGAVLRHQQAAAEIGASAEASYPEAWRSSTPLHPSEAGPCPPWNPTLQVQGMRGGRLLSAPANTSLLPTTPKASVAERAMSLPEGNDAGAQVSPRHWQLLSHEVLCEELLEEESRPQKAAASPVKPSCTHTFPPAKVARTAPPVHRLEDPSLLQGGRMLSLGPSAFSCDPQLSLTSSALAEFFAMEQSAGDEQAKAPAAEEKGPQCFPQSSGTAWEPSVVPPGAGNGPYYSDADLQSTGPFPEAYNPLTAASLDSQSHRQLEASQGACSAYLGRYA